MTLTGAVDWHFQEQAAVSDVRNLWGVTGLSNEITVRPRPDASAIKEKIMVALNRSWLDPANIDVAANDGKVKLTGEVNSWYERDEAGSAAWAAPGAISVENNITVN